MFGTKSSHANDETPSLVRDAWRAQLFDDLAEKAAQRRRAAAMSRAVLAGVLLGIAGSFSLYMV